LSENRHDNPPGQNPHSAPSDVPPPSPQRLRRVGILVAVVAVIVAVALGTGVVELISLAPGRLSLPPAVLLGVILDVAVIAILAMFGRRRQKAARAKATGGS